MSAHWWLAVAAASTVYFGTVTDADNDLWMHLFVGRWIAQHSTVPRLDTFSYTATGERWVNHEWLWQVLAFQSFSWGGSRALLVGKLLLTLTSVILLACSATAVRQASTTACGTQNNRVEFSGLRAILFLLAIPALGRGWAIRPQLISYLLLPGLVFALVQWERGHRWPWFVLPLLFTAWVNLHGGFAFGLAVLCIFTAVGLSTGIAEVVRRGFLAILSFAATVANPYGIALYSYLIEELSRPHPISEWQPVALAAEHSAFLLFAAAFLATLPWLPRNRTTAWCSAMTVAALILAVRHQRHTPVFVLAALPLTELQVENLVASARRRGFRVRPQLRQAIFAGVAGIACVQMFLTAVRLWSDGGRVTFNPSEYPVAAVHALKAGKAQGNLAVPLDWGGYVLWHLAPAVRPSLDGRFATVYPQEVVTDNFAFFRAERGWRRLLEAYPTQAVLLPAEATHPLMREPGWLLVYADAVALLYVQQEFVQQFRPAKADFEVLPSRFFP